MQPRRLAAGGRINREKPVNFSFNGKPFQGLEGDTLASALLANGVNVVARSFKYGRPRGIVGHGAEEWLGPGHALDANRHRRETAFGKCV